jgi:hypothetical protein
MGVLMIPLLLCLLTLTPPAASAAPDLAVRTEDGLELRFAPNGDVVGVWADGAAVPTGGLVGGMFVSEVGPDSPSPATRVPARAARDGATVVLVGEDAAKGYRVRVRWEARGKQLALSGEIEDTARRDRCLRVAYRLPVAAVGGTWWNDIQDATLITEQGRSSFAGPFGVLGPGEFGPFSVYPFSAVDLPPFPAHSGGGVRNVGLSLAVPMHPPRPFRLGYDPTEGYTVEWDFGLSPIVRKYPSRADFFALLYRHDPQWGFRAAAKSYYELFPEWFAVRVPRQGNWYYHDLTDLPHPEDFGLAFNEKLSESTVVADRKLGLLPFAYTEPWGWWSWAVGQHPAEDDPQPSYEEALAAVKAKAAQGGADSQTGRDMGTLTALAARGGVYSQALVAQSILNSGTWDAEGRYTRGGYVAKWGGYNWLLNPSPFAEPERGVSRFRLSYDWEVEPGLTMGAAGVLLDSIDFWAGMPDYRPEHLAAAQHPLTFSGAHPRPAELGVWSQYEFAEYLARDLHGRGKLLMANIFTPTPVFFSHLLDVLGHEVWDKLDPNLPYGVPPPVMRAQRTLAYRKPYCWLMQFHPEVSAAERERWMQEAMLLGIFPNIVGGTTETAEYERFRPLFRKYMPTMLALAEAGWEPVTYARSNAPIWLERFGPKDGRLLLSVRNPGETEVLAHVTIDWPALGITPAEQGMRRPDGTQVRPSPDGTWAVRLNAGETAVYEFRSEGSETQK